MMVNPWDVLGYLLGAALFVLVFLFARDAFLSLHPPKNAAILTTRAKVFSKAMNNGKYGSAYYIAFLLPGGVRKNIQVMVEEYNTIEKGEKGLLTYKEHKGHIWFVSFQPDA